MIVQKTSIFPAPRDAVFQKLQRLETLQTIAKPYAVFEPVDSAAAVWTVGGKSSYRLRLFGFIPFGAHTIWIVRFDPDGVSSREGNRHVPVWNHDILLVPIDENHTEYTDRVEIRAGWVKEKDLPSTAPGTRSTPRRQRNACCGFCTAMMTI
ncbi:MAG: hypothetical protein IJ210_10535, partial [Clostridia bacterium]|nr:hypothetical protein [Clostridia bacterium]